MSAQLEREFELWQRQAEARGWVIPHGDVVTQENWWPAWLNYWKQMDRYEHDESYGRPIPPHRSA